MNYYIQGDAANADKIRAAFEAKAIYSELSFANENYLYYSCDGAVAFCFICGGLANIIKTHPDYKELELPVEPKFKVGDWVACIDDEGDMATEKIVTFSHNKVLLLDTDGCQTEYPKTELSNFHLWTIQDAKDGDVLVNDAGCIFISAGFEKDDKVTLACYCYVSVQGIFYEEDHKTGSWLYVSHIHPATKEQCDLLFKKMKEAGYTWDENKKELKKFPKKHYDISSFHAGMPVLVRADNVCRWNYSVFSHITGNKDWQFAVCNGVSFTQCIPFEGNEHLLGTTDVPDERFINW